MDDFKLFARDRGISSMKLNSFASVNPMVIEEKKSFAASYDIFSRLLKDRIIFLGTAIDDEVANIIQAELLYLACENDKADISLYINSPGGYVSSGLAIYDTMQLIKPDVATVCTGMAASMGSVLLCAGADGKRSALPHSKVMIHQPMGGAYGQASDILINAKEIEKTRNELYEILASHSKQPFDKIFADADRDYWMSAQEALEYGMIDNIKGQK